MTNTVQSITLTFDQRAAMDHVLECATEEQASAFGKLLKTKVEILDFDSALEAVTYAKGLRAEQLRDMGQKAVTNAHSSLIRKISALPVQR